MALGLVSVVFDTSPWDLNESRNQRKSLDFVVKTPFKIILQNTFKMLVKSVRANLRSGNNCELLLLQIL